jgi:micrococcal nuclease
MDLFLGFVFAWSVIDGDTVKVSVHVWPNVAAIEERIRLVRIDTPETRAPAPACERELGAKAKAYTLARMTAAKRIVVRAGTDVTPSGMTTRDSFGRVLGDVIVDGVSLSDDLLAQRLARLYTGSGTKVPWC